MHDIIILFINYCYIPPRTLLFPPFRRPWRSANTYKVCSDAEFKTIVADGSVIGLLRMRKRELGAKLEQAHVSGFARRTVPLTSSSRLNPWITFAVRETKTENLSNDVL